MSKAMIDIPRLSDEQVIELLKRIRPLIRLRDNTLHYVNTETNRAGGLFNPRRTDIGCYADVTWDQQIVTDLVPVDITTTRHTIWGFAGFFQPNIAEVLAQIPEFWIDSIVAFEVLQRAPVIVEEGHHVARTLHYVKAGD